VQWLRELFSKRQIYRDLSDEIQQHLDEKIEALVDEGMNRDDAEHAARREFGNLTLLEEKSREVWQWPRLESIASDMNYALRQVRRSPGFALAVIATLALGIGASTAMFTVVDHVLLRPLPYKKVEQLVEIKEAGKKGPSMLGAPFLDLQQWRERSHTLQSVAFHTYIKPICFLDGDSTALQVNAPRVSANLFSTLGVHPALGRDFNPQDSDGFTQGPDTRTIVLSDAVWRDGFGANPEVVGRIVKLNGDSYTVIGIMPRGFRFPFNTEKAQVWIPVVLGEADKTRSANVTPEYRIVARLKDDISIDEARAELKVVQAKVAKEYTNPDVRDSVLSVELQKYGDSIVEGNIGKALLALLGASALLWLIACTNVTGLLLARATARQREIAVRGALGASHWRIVGQLLVEGMLLSGAAALLGSGLVVFALRLFERQLTTKLGFPVGLKPDVRIICVLLGLTVISAMLSSVWPALVAAKTSIESALKQGCLQSGARKSQHRTRGLLVVTEIAMSLTLLVACGLLLRTIYALRHVPLGYRTDHIVVADMVIPAYKFDGKNMTIDLYQPLIERVQQLPGVQAASLITGVPLARRMPILFSLDTKGEGKDASRKRDLVAQFRAVGPELQRVLGFRMLKGRFFNEGDTPGSEPVVVVNRAFVRAYLGEDQDPGKILGEELLSYQKNKPAKIVGILDDARQASASLDSQPELQVCIPQITPESGFYRVTEGLAMSLAVRTERSPAAIVPELREILQRASPALAGSNFTTMDQVVEDSYGDQRIAARLLQIFGGSALLVCATGLYGLLAYLVTQRTQEFGVRIALGAQRGQVIWLVMRQAGWTLVAGSMVGLMMSYFSSRMLGSFLYGVKTHDALTMGTAILLLLCAGLAAAYFPARRAASVDPMEALRTE
jgi:predicted permease